MKKAKKILTLVACAVLLVCISVGATIAYLTAQDTVVNTFTVGNVQIKLDEAEVNPDGTYVTDHNNRVKANKYHLLPGHTYYKDPTVTVLENSEPCFVRIQVTVTDYDKLAAAIKTADTETEKYTYTVDDIEYPALHMLVGGWEDDNWIYKSVADATETVGEEAVTTKKAVYEFWYKEIVDKNDENDTVLDDLFETITMPAAVANKELATLGGVEINVTAHAIQADGFADAEKAWVAFVGQ